MKSLLRLAVLAGLLPAVASAGDTRSIDTYGELVRFRTEHLGAQRAFSLNTDQFLRGLVDDPTAFYTELSDTPGITNEVWWELFLERLPMDRVASSRRTLDALKWHLGLSKARPGVDVMIDDWDIANFRGREVAANARKAGVDPDIFWKAADMNGTTKTVAAAYAVALQILRDQMKAYDRAEYGARAIKPEVLERYMSQTRPGRIADYDERYLADLLRQEITRHGSATDRESRHALPAAYRVARVAAAYADNNGYVSSGICGSGDGPGPGRALRIGDVEAHGPLCFYAATDRAVQWWYRNEFRKEAQVLRQRERERSSPLMQLLGTVLVLIDVVSFVEVVEAVVAEDLAAQGAIEEADAEVATARSHRLACRIAP